MQILFLVLINNEEFRTMATIEIHLAELTLYVITLLVVIIGIVQVCYKE